MATVGHSVEYFAARVGMGLARMLSSRTADWLGASLGRAAHLALGSRRRLAFDNIKQAMGDSLSDAAIDEIVKAVFANTGRTIVELSRIAKLGKDRLREMIVPAGLAQIEAARAKGRGALIATAHFGNWELMGIFPSLFGVPSDTLAITQHNLQVNEAIINLRQSTGVRILEVPANARQVFRSLKENRVVILAADQHASAGTLVMDFFGRPAAIARGPALFAIRQNCPLIPMLIRRERFDRHIVIAGHDIHPPNTGDEEADLRTITAAYLRFLEENIRKYPDQWLWTHNRWKLKPTDGNSEPETA